MNQRCLPKNEAAEYCGMTPNTFDKWRREQGILPVRRGVFDRKVLDKVLDRLGGLIDNDYSKDEQELIERAWRGKK